MQVGWIYLWRWGNRDKIKDQQLDYGHAAHRLPQTSSRCLWGQLQADRPSSVTAITLNWVTWLDAIVMTQSLTYINCTDWSCCQCCAVMSGDKQNIYIGSSSSCSLQMCLFLFIFCANNLLFILDLNSMFFKLRPFELCNPTAVTLLHSRRRSIFLIIIEMYRIPIESLES